jgi:DNA sulfur modification protein DndB
MRTGPLYAGDLSNQTLGKAYLFFKLLFSLIQEKLNEQWEIGSGEGGFVARNIGIASFIVITWDIVDFIRKEKLIVFEKLNSEEIFDEIKPYLMPIIKYLLDLSPDDMHNMSKQWGSTGVSKVRREFQRVINQKYENFEPDGLRQYIKESSGIYNTETRQNILVIQEAMKEYIPGKLKEEFKDEWWRLGVHKEIQKDCSSRSIDAGGTEPPENFLLVLDYQKIIDNNWTLLGKTFSPPDKHGKKKVLLEWFVKFNSIRNQVMHPERRNVTEDEYNFINDIKSWLLERIKDK